MATEESSKFSSNLKVPPLKIVLSSHQNNSVMNVGRVNVDKEDSSNDHGEQRKESSRRSSIEACIDEPVSGSDRQSSKKGSKNQSSERNSEPDQPLKATVDFSPSSSSSSSTASDRSSSATPSSESESVASNSTIISDQQNNGKNVKSDQIKDEVSVNTKNEIKTQRGTKGAASERSGSFVSSAGNKRSHEDISTESNTTTTATNNNINNNAPSVARESTSNSNQRITRSSQRAAQQNKSENPNEAQNEDSNVAENQEKNLDTTRKVKRRKGEPQEIESDANQSANPPPIVMATIHPADYQLPSQNSFELYRDIRERPYKKMLELNHIQPKVPHGFKDYLMNGGPYLLDGNKLGVGLSGTRPDSDLTPKIKTKIVSRNPMRSRITNLKRKFSSQQASQHRHNSYIIPKLVEAPKSLTIGSPLYELYIDQERARQQMRMQHLKERERSVLAAEQEILRAYNKVAIADVGQKFHLSACTYFYYQERYHYIDDKTNPSDKTNSNEVPHSQDNSFLCIEGGETSKTVTTTNSNGSHATSPMEKVKDLDEDSVSSDGTVQQLQQDNDSVTVKKDKGDDSSSSTSVKKVNENGDSEKESSTSKSKKVKPQADGSAKTEAGENKSDITTAGSEDTKTKGDTSENDNINTTPSDIDKKNENKSSSSEKQPDTDPDSGLGDTDGKQNSSLDKCIPSEDFKDSNRKIFLDQLQEIDDKWDNIRRDMCTRHRNEADSLFAVQTLEWEWKAKEIGVCDVRVTLKIDPEFVPRVEVSALDY